MTKNSSGPSRPSYRHLQSFQCSWSRDLIAVFFAKVLSIISFLICDVIHDESFHPTGFKAPFIWERVVPGTRVTLLPEVSLPWVYMEKKLPRALGSKLALSVGRLGRVSQNENLVDRRIVQSLIAVISSLTATLSFTCHTNIALLLELKSQQDVLISQDASKQSDYVRFARQKTTRSKKDAIILEDSRAN